MICPSCGSDRAYEARNYDTGEDWWICSECGDGAPLQEGCGPEVALT